MPDTSKLGKLNRELEKSEKKLRKAINDEKALFRIQPVEQRRFQFLILQQYRRPKPPAQQGIGNGLDTDTFLPIVQGDTVSVDVVTALMHQPPHSAVLAGKRLSMR